MINLKPYSSNVLAIAGIILAGIGVYFIFLRPSLLPEDLTYMGSTMQNVQQNLPGLLSWLQKVFWVMGGYIFTTGVLIVFISLTSFRSRLQGVCSIVALAGISSIGSMTVVNFLLDSDFKWLLFIFAIPWLLALILFRFRI